MLPDHHGGCRGAGSDGAAFHVASTRHAPCAHQDRHWNLSGSADDALLGEIQDGNGSEAGVRGRHCGVGEHLVQSLHASGRIARAAVYWQTAIAEASLGR
jgi:hypothetical protein